MMSHIEIRFYVVDHTSMYMLCAAHANLILSPNHEHKPSWAPVRSMSRGPRAHSEVTGSQSS